MDDGTSSTTTPPAELPRLVGAGRRAAWAVAAVLGVAAVAVPSAIGWAAGSESGTAWLLTHLPGIDITAPRGALVGDRLSADRVRVAWAGGAGEIQIDGLELRGLQWQVRHTPGVWAHATLASARVRSVQIKLPPPTSQPLAMPLTLRSLVSMTIAAWQVDSLRIDAAEPVVGLQGALQIGADGGRTHRVTGVRFAWDRLVAEAGTVTIAASAPFETSAGLQARSVRGAAWQAAVTAAGPLARLELLGALRGVPVGARAAPNLDVRAQMRPFEAWPLGPLELTTRELDLSALASAWPATRLSGRASVLTANRRAPMTAELTLDNAEPGRWDVGRLPIRRAVARLVTDPARAGRVELPAFEVEWASDRGDAGRWLGQGVLEGRNASIDSRWVDLQPQRLDARAAAMRLSGPMTLRVKDLPMGLTPAPAQAWQAVSAEFALRVEGAFDRSTQKVMLQIEGTATPRRIDLTAFRATAGDATAQGMAQLRIEPGQPVQWVSRGRLDRFDPVPWFPGPEGSAWRRGPHRLNGQWQLDLALPVDALRGPPVHWLQAAQGEGVFSLVDSRWAGVPLQARLQLTRAASGPPGQRSHATGRVELGRNVVTIDGRGDPASRGDADRWQLVVSAPAVAELAPLAALVPELAEWTPRKGAVDAKVQAQGRWPALRTDGELSVQGLQLGPLVIARGRATWGMETAASQSLDVQSEATDIVYGARRIDSWRAQVRGTAAAHRLSAELTAPMRPPESLVRALGLRHGEGTQIKIDGQGGWAPEPSGGGVWRARMSRVSAGVWSGVRGEPADASWLDTTELQGELRVDGTGRITSVTAPAGRAMLAGGIGLRWSSMQWRDGPSRPEISVQAETDPFVVAPMLQRLSTGARSTMQWGGNLRLAARLDLRSGDRVDAELQLHRVDGDLSMQDGATPQFLGLSDVDFRLTAHDGEWRFTPLFIGRTLGTISGAFTARTTPQARWPEPRSALDGAIGIQVPQLDVWAGWLPPGWRIEGTMVTTARVAGTLGAPEYTGELRAERVGLRNLLQGVALHDGELIVALKGDTAQVERLRIRSGDGSLSATGRALFSAAPQVTLEARADKFRMLGRVDRQLVVSGQAALFLQADRLRLDGKLAVDSGLFDLSARDAPGLDDDVNVRRDGAAGAERPTPGQAAPVMRNAAVALEVDLGKNLRLRGRGLDTFLGGQLKISAPGGRLAINGAVRAESGTYAAYGQKLEIERGVVSFSGPPDSARLDILALRPNLDMRVGVAIAGTALNPRVRLYSEPDMSETDKLSWLVLGRGPDGLGRTDTALLQRAAVALLSGEGEGPTDGLIRAIGLDDVSLRQTDGEVRETVITLGKQLSRRWYVGYERGVNATTGTWQLIYRIAQRFTLRAQSGLENSLDLIWTWRFGGP